MMQAFAFVDANGVPTGGGSRREVPPGAVALTDGLTTLDLPELILVNGVWSRRPALGMWDVPEGMVVSPAAPGLVIEVTDTLDGTVRTDVIRTDTGVATLTLPADGDFMITARADLPWLGITLRRVMGLGSPALRAAEVARVRIAARARFYGAVGRARLAFVTDIPGQQNIYAEKQAEARAYLIASPEPATLTDYPLIAAEVGITAPTPYQMAQLWSNMAVLFKQVAAGTERLRMKVSAALEAATTEAEIDAIQTGATEALATLLNPT